MASVKQLPLFIASTFRDMDDERDELVHVVLPQVNERLRAAGHDSAVYPVDLRWGITSRQHQDLASRERFILDTCVAEVRRCQPLFLGLLGDKYGYVADQGVRGPVVAEAGLGEDQALPLSVTAIELLTAARSAAQHGIPPVLLRRRLDPEDAAAASASRGLDYVDRPELVDRLCERLLDEGQPVEEYRSTWEADSGRLASAEFVGLTVQAILAQVTRALPARREIDWLARELAAQREHSRALREVMVGRDRALHEINEFLTGFLPTMESMDSEARKIDLSELRPAELERITITSTSLTLTGAPGVGLSTLIARATEAPARWSSDPQEFLAKALGKGDPGPRLCAVVHIGATRHSASPAVALLLLLAQLDWPTANQLASVGPEQLSLNEVLEHWLEALRRLPPMEKAVIALDGLDFLRAHDGLPKVWAWIPLDVGNSAVFLVATRAKSVYAELLNARPGNTFLEVMDMTELEGKHLVGDLAARRHHLLPVSVRSSLVARSLNPRWLTLATDVLLTLTGQEYRLLRHPALQEYDDEEALEVLLNVEAQRLPLEPASLQLTVVSRLQRLMSDIARAVPSLIALCGVLRETDVLAILEEASLHPGPGDIATVRALLRQSIGSDGPYLWPTDMDFIAKIAESEARGGWLPRHENIVVHYLLNLPNDDEIRSASLGAVLLALGRFDDLAAALVAPDSSAERVARSAGPVLRELIEDRPQLPEDLLAACATDAQRLTMAELLLAISGQSAPEQESAIHRDVQRHLSTVSPVARTRTGNTAASLGHLSQLTVAGQMAELQKWRTAAVQRTEDMLHDLPSPFGWTDNSDLSERAAHRGAGHLIEAVDAVVGLLTGLAMFDEITINKRDTITINRLLSSLGEVKQSTPERLWPVLEGYSRALVDLAACLLDRHLDVAASLVEEARKLAQGDDVNYLICAVRLFDVAALVVLRGAHQPPRTASDLLTLCEARGILWESYWLARGTSSLMPTARPLATIVTASALKVMMAAHGVWNGDLARAGVTGLSTDDAIRELGEGWLSLAMLALAANMVAFTDVDPGPLASMVPTAVERYPSALEDNDWQGDDPELMTLAVCLYALGRSRLSEGSLVLTLLARLTDPARSRRAPLSDVYEAVNEALVEFENDLLQWEPEKGFEGEPPDAAIAWGRELANTLIGLDAEDVCEAEKTRRTAEIAARARFHLFLLGVATPENVLGVALTEVVSMLIGSGDPLFTDDPGFDCLRSATEAMFQNPELPPRERHGVQVVAGLMNEIASWS